jgi:hypothetical protein
LLVNIIKLKNNKEYDLINYKIHGCILHVSMIPDELGIPNTGRGGAAPIL